MKSRLFVADVISEEISDHRQLIHHGILFWNVMMQGRVSQGGRYNNAFGLVESDERYMQRLDRVAKTIIQLLEKNDDIGVIALCEGPILTEHLNYFMTQLKCASVMQRFINKTGEEFYRPNTEHYHHWGLLLMADNKYRVEPVMLDRMQKLAEFPKLANRLQMWSLSYGGLMKFVTLAHFPYAQDVHNTEADQFSHSGNIHRLLIEDTLNEYSNEDLVFCADFNFNPYLIRDHKMRRSDLIPYNNILLTEQIIESGQKTMSVTVDGILLSTFNKQRRYWLEQVGLFAIAKKEWKLMRNFLLGKVEMFPYQENQLSLGACR